MIKLRDLLQHCSCDVYIFGNGNCPCPEIQLPKPLVKAEKYLNADILNRGVRNPMNSWEKSDSTIVKTDHEVDDYIDIGKTDYLLMQRLSKAGTDHRKFMRMMPVYVRITAPLYWWKEFDTYKVGTVSNSCSTMHKIHDKEFTLEDFSTEYLSYPSLKNLKDIIKCMNDYREEYLKDKEKHNWWQMIQLLPSSYNQTRNVMMNYEVLANIYQWRKDHKLDEWREFCKWIEGLPYSELITGLPIESDDADED